MTILTLFAQATGDEPAGGAAAVEAIGASVGALIVTTAIVLLIAGHRGGRIAWLARAAAAAERATSMPVWAALPSMLLGVSLLVAVIGMYWDISLHIDNGRDAGPLTNPAHYLILVGLYGVLLAGVLSIALATERPSSAALDLRNGWWMPAGALIMVACGVFALTGFPLDDFWHRLFGQDVTLWGPTHLMLIGGGSLATLGGMALTAEAVRFLGRDPERDGPKTAYAARRGLLVGGFLVALSSFQAEFDFGVPQFRQVLHPILIMLAAGVGLVTARVYLGRGGALQALVGYLVIRVLLAVLVGGVWGQTLPHFPLYLVEALLVEAAFLGSRPRSPVARGALAGILLGTIGLAAEWGWSQLWMPIPWSFSLLPEALVAGLATAIGAGVVGGFIGGALVRPVESSRAGRRGHLAALTGLAVVVTAVGWGLPISAEGPAQARVRLEGDGRQVHAAVSIRPAEGLDDAHFLNVTAWQGGASEVSELERVGPGEYHTAEPIPVHGSWKTLVRLHTGDSLVGVPIHLPEDRAIPAAAVRAKPVFTRPFVRDLLVLQRERKEGVAGWLTALAYLTVAALGAALIALVAWALLRLEVAGGGRSRRREVELVGTETRQRRAIW
jgi:hypothetical protein